MRPLRIASPLLLLILNSRVVFSLQLNIHMPLQKVNDSWSFDLCPYSAALEANLALRDNSESEQLNFFETHTPHVTLFLTEFDVEEDDQMMIDEIAAVVQEVVSNHSHIMCQVEWPQQPAAHVASAYAMYSLPHNDCLQQLSNDIVRALQPYVKHPQAIPDWINNLPSIVTRWRKIWNIQKYGSPNVFGDYAPHVTVGYDEEADSDERKRVLQERLPQEYRVRCQGLLTTVAVGRVGPGGSVLQSGLVRAIRLNEPATSVR